GRRGGRREREAGESQLNADGEQVEGNAPEAAEGTRAPMLTDEPAEIAATDALVRATTPAIPAPATTAPMAHAEPTPVRAAPVEAPAPVATVTEAAPAATPEVPSQSVSEPISEPVTQAPTIAPIAPVAP
ncbi:ribonuclease E/G, partial [Pandoraea pneumonica]